MCGALLAVLLAATHWWATRNTVELCYQMSGVQGRTAAYWEAGNGFAESRSRKAHLPLDGASKRMCFASFGMRSPRLVRLDPVDRTSEFVLFGAELRYLDTIFPFRKINRYSLDSANAANNQIIADPNRTGHYSATGGDPWFSLAVPVKRFGGWRQLTAQMLLPALLLAVGMGIAWRRRAALPAAVPLLAIYPLFLLFAYASDAFGSFIRHAETVLWFSLLLFLTVVLLPVGRRWSVRRSLGLTIVLAIGYVVSFDLAFRLGLHQRPAFMLGGNQVYHWSLNLPQGSNWRHSSMRYYRDFERLNDLLEPGSGVLSDIATSYYLAAATPLYPVNLHNHHSTAAGQYRKLLGRVCAADRQTSPAVLEDFRNDNRRRQNAGLPPVRYLIVNRDSINRNVSGSCLTVRANDVLNAFPGALRLEYRGEYLQAYRFVL